MRIVLDWQLSSFFGWGIYGLNLAQQAARNPAVEARALTPVDLRKIHLDALAMRALAPFFDRSQEVPPRDAMFLSALGNNLLGMPPRAGRRQVGIVFFEKPLDAEVAERAKRFELIVAGSSWNERLLREAGVENVTTILQGIDTSLFHPAPKRGLFPDRFVIFSGGKAEPRKGQDLVVKAFRVFARKHPEAMLVTAWHSPWPQLAAGMDLDLTEFADRVIDVGAVPNAAMPQILRECDVALFPNRAEGGTNLVAMECLASGVPVILSANTGHLDLMGPAESGSLILLRAQGACPVCPGGGESSVEEILAALEYAFGRFCYGVLRHNAIPNLTWAESARKLLQTVETAHERRQAA